MYIRFPVTYLSFLSDFNKTRILSTDFREKLIRRYVQWEQSCAMRTGKQTAGLKDKHDEYKTRFSQFCERPNNGLNSAETPLCTVEKAL